MWPAEGLGDRVVVTAVVRLTDRGDVDREAWPGPAAGCHRD